MSLQDTLQSITSRQVGQGQVDPPASEVSTLADDARNIMAALMVRPTADVRKMIELFSPIAEKFLQELISGKYPDASLALRAKYASLALARAGFGPIHNVRSLHANLTKEDIEVIKDRAIAYAMSDQRKIDYPPASQVIDLPVHQDSTNTSMNPMSEEQNQLLHT